MSINIEQVMDYLDTHPVSRYEGDFQSLLEMIHYIFATCNPVDSREIQEKFSVLGDLLSPLSVEAENAVSSLVCDLCYDHEQTGFNYGVIVGMQLMSEINALP